jgi:hypothetical protein
LEDAFDVCVRFGEPPDARVIAQAGEPSPPVRSPGYGAAAPHAGYRRTIASAFTQRRAYGLWH